MLPVRLLITALVMSLVFTMIGCDALNPEQPTRWDDITLYGNFLEVTQSPKDPNALIVQMRIGMPRALGSAKETEGKPTPTVEKGTVAEVTVIFGQWLEVLEGGLDQETYLGLVQKLRRVTTSQHLPARYGEEGGS